VVADLAGGDRRAERLTGAGDEAELDLDVELLGRA
jgi:hypothetical protein